MFEKAKARNKCKQLLNEAEKAAKVGAVEKVTAWFRRINNLGEKYGFDTSGYVCKQTPLEIEAHTAAAERYERIAEASIKIVNGYTAATVGVGDGLLVDSEGVVSVASTQGGYEPVRFLDSLFSKLLREDFIVPILVRNPSNLDQFIPVNAYQFGKRSLMIGPNGILYHVADGKGLGLMGARVSTAKCYRQQLGTGLNLEDRAYLTAARGYDQAALQIAKNHVAAAGQLHNKETSKTS